MPQDLIEREVTVDAPRDRVWDVITQAEHLGTWFGDSGAEIDLRPGGRLLLRWAEYGEGAARVERVDPPAAFAFRWFTNDTESLDIDELDEGNSTLVEFTLEAAGEGTLLRVRESGFASLDRPAEAQSTLREGNVEGWRRELDELVDYAASVRS